MYYEIMLYDNTISYKEYYVRNNYRIEMIINEIIECQNKVTLH